MHRMQEFHIICDCQRNAIRERTLLRRSIRGARYVGFQLKRRGVAIAVGLPIACFALGFPIEAMNNAAIVRDFEASPVTNAFLPRRAVEPVSLEALKERFFDNEVPYGSIIYREARRNGLAPEL